MDHDQQFKELLREFWRELLALFVPGLAARLTADAPAWQSQEVFTNPPLGLVKRVDLLALLTLGDGESALHVEIESGASLSEARKKLGYYYPALRMRYNLPITTLAVYLKVGMKGLGFDAYEEREAKTKERLFQTRWRYVGLPALSAERYLESKNCLGVALAALMKIDAARKPWLRAEILRRLATECQENDYRKLLLVNCVNTYLRLEGEQLEAYNKLVSQDERYQEATKMIGSTYAKLKEEGQRETLREVIFDLASPKCGEPDEATRQAVNQIEDVARLKRLYKAISTVQTWAQLLSAE